MSAHISAYELFCFSPAHYFLSPVSFYPFLSCSIILTRITKIFTHLILKEEIITSCVRTVSKVSFKPNLSISANYTMLTRLGGGGRAWIEKFYFDIIYFFYCTNFTIALLGI